MTEPLTLWARESVEREAQELGVSPGLLLSLAHDAPSRPSALVCVCPLCAGTGRDDVLDECPECGGARYVSERVWEHYRRRRSLVVVPSAAPVESARKRAAGNVAGLAFAAAALLTLPVWGRWWLWVLVALLLVVVWTLLVAAGRGERAERSTEAP